MTEGTTTALILYHQQALILSGCGSPYPYPQLWVAANLFQLDPYL